MKLTLSLRTSPPREGVEAERVLEEGSMTIGRAPDATWTIPDPARVISKKHCRIDASPGGFTITDISTNGAFLNEQPIGRDSTRKLSDGDLVRMGDIVIAARIEDVGDKQAEPEHSVLLSDGPFGEHEASAAPRPGNGLAPAAAGAPLAEGPIAEDWWKEPPPLAAVNGIARLAGTAPSLANGDTIVINLVGRFPDLDVATLAQAMDAAGAVIGDRDWRTFYDRLQAYLRDRYPENA
ncbi:MAG: FHA domain-containing protein [Rhizobiaceae bacterium]